MVCGLRSISLLVIFVGGQLGLTSNKYLLYFRGVLISWVRAHHEIHEIKTPRIFCRFTVFDLEMTLTFDLQLNLTLTNTFLVLECASRYYGKYEVFDLHMTLTLVFDLK